MNSIGYLFKEGARSLWKNRTMSLASIMVLISCLLLMGVAGLLSVNLSVWMTTIEKNNNITVYLKDSTPPLVSLRVGEEFRKMDNVAEAVFKSKEDGMKDMIELFGKTGELLEGLSVEEIFLPDGYIIKLEDLSRYDETMGAIKEMEQVATVVDYSATATKLSNLDKLVRYSSVAIVAILGIVSLFIISNTIKVTMFSRRVEISIMKSVGATNMFVRVPFIVEGIIIGVISGLTSAAVLYFAYGKMTGIIYSIAPFLGAVNLEGLFWLVFVAYAVIGMSFGIWGCGISIGKYLKNEGQNAII